MGIVSGRLVTCLGYGARYWVLGFATLALAGSSAASVSNGPGTDAAVHAAPSGRELQATARLDPIPSNPRDAELIAHRVTAGGLARKWQALNADIHADTATITQCRQDMRQCAPHVARFIAIIDNARMHHGRALLGDINRAINLAVRPVSDERRHGSEDVWSAPLSTFAAGTGDCEDYAIAKYVALRHAGIQPADLKLDIVRDTARNIDHAVLSVRLDGRWLVLDNRRFLLVEQGSIPNYTPLFTLDEGGVIAYTRASASLPAQAPGPIH